MVSTIEEKAYIVIRVLEKAGDSDPSTITSVALIQMHPPGFTSFIACCEYKIREGEPCMPLCGLFGGKEES